MSDINAIKARCSRDGKRGSPRDVPWLVAEVERLRGVIDLTAGDPAHEMQLGADLETALRALYDLLNASYDFRATHREDRFVVAVAAAQATLSAIITGDQGERDNPAGHRRAHVPRSDLETLVESLPRCAVCEMLLGDDVHKGFDGELCHARCCSMCGDNPAKDGPPA